MNKYKEESMGEEQEECAECERLQNLPPGEAVRACEDHEDGYEVFPGGWVGEY